MGCDLDNGQGHGDGATALPGRAGPGGGAGTCPDTAGPDAGLHIALARCERQIIELQRAMGSAASTPDGPPERPAVPDNDWINERLCSLESRVIEQDQTIRHTLTMLIDWIERDEARGMAA